MVFEVAILVAGATIVPIPMYTLISYCLIIIVKYYPVLINFSACKNEMSCAETKIISLTSIIGHLCIHFSAENTHAVVCNVSLCVNNMQYFVCF